MKALHITTVNLRAEWIIRHATRSVFKLSDTWFLRLYITTSRMALSMHELSPISYCLCWMITQCTSFIGHRLLNTQHIEELVKEPWFQSHGGFCVWKAAVFTCGLTDEQNACPINVAIAWSRPLYGTVRGFSTTCFMRFLWFVKEDCCNMMLLFGESVLVQIINKSPSHGYLTKHRIRA